MGSSWINALLFPFCTLTVGCSSHVVNKFGNHTRSLSSVLSFVDFGKVNQTVESRCSFTSVKLTQKLYGVVFFLTFYKKIL